MKCLLIFVRLVVPRFTWRTMLVRDGADGRKEVFRLFRISEGMPPETVAVAKVRVFTWFGGVIPYKILDVVPVHIFKMALVLEGLMRTFGSSPEDILKKIKEEMKD